MKKIVIAACLLAFYLDIPADSRTPEQFGPHECRDCGTQVGSIKVLDTPIPDRGTRLFLSSFVTAQSQTATGFHSGDSVKVCTRDQCVVYTYRADGSWDGGAATPRVNNSGGTSGHENTGNNAGGPPPGNIADNRWGWACGTVEAGGGTVRNCFVTP